MKNYELLDRKWMSFMSPEELVQKETSARYADFNAGACSRGIAQAQFFPCFHHLGFGPISAALVRQKVQAAVDQSVRYFTTKWWTTDVVNPEAYRGAGFTDPAVIESAIQECLRNIDKSRSDRELIWLDAFTSAMFCCGLTGRWEELKRICTWFDATIEPGYSAGTIEDEYQLALVYIACSMNPDHAPPGREGLLEKVKKSRLKRPRNLIAIWEAIASQDQKGFSKAFSEGVNHFLAKTESTGELFRWVDTVRSALLLLAQQHGLQTPDLSDQQQAAIVTPASAGMLE